MSKGGGVSKIEKPKGQELDESLYEEGDDFQEEQLSASASEVMSAVNKRKADVSSLLNKGNNKDAIKLALTDPPVNTKDQKCKEINAETVFSVISNVKESDIDNVLSGLGEEDYDILMKYIYRGLAEVNNPGLMLKWHEKIFEKQGLGCIVRTLVERRTV